MEQENNQLAKKQEPISLATLAKQYTPENSLVLKTLGDPIELARVPAPENIASALEAPKIVSLKNTWGTDNIAACLMVMVEDCATMLGFENNGHAVGLVVEDFMEMYPYFSIEDFMVFFTRARRRTYGKTFHKNDWQVFYLWIEQYDISREKDLEKYNKELSKAIDEGNTKLLASAPTKTFDQMPVEFQEQFKKDLGTGDLERKESAYRSAKAKTFEVEVTCKRCSIGYNVQRYTPGNRSCNYCPHCATDKETEQYLETVL